MKARKVNRIRSSLRRSGKALLYATSGVAVVEFAFVLPILLMLLFGILTYGNYYYLAHSVQQLANDAARSTLAGLTAQEREDLAEEAALEAAKTGAIDADRLDVEAKDDNPFVRVSVRYDASNSALFKINLLPLPDPVISRTATVRMGGL